MLKETGEDWINLGLILYDFDLFNLRPEGKLELDKLVRYMKQHPDVFVELQSHTDSRGTYEYNIWLAEQRSQSCVNYIISNGISSSQIIPKGYGERRLKNSCNDFTVCTEDEHQENRRTELHIKLTKDAIIDSSNLNSNLKINNSLLLSDSIYFRVQLISSSKKISASSKIFRNLPIYEYEDKGLYKYCLSEKFNSIESSKQKALSLRLNGFPEAFIVVFKNDKRFK
jgi:L-rhamnose mutarotase